jgi:two-component system chemotaxis response regulator CheY
MKPKADMRFLVVDDSSTMRHILRACLVRYGVNENNIQAAADGKEAIAILATDPFDCVLCDWNMPNGNGLNVLSEMRGSPAHLRTPFVMVTTEASREDVITAIKAGADEYLAKPITPETLAKKLDALLNQAGGTK